MNLGLGWVIACFFFFKQTKTKIKQSNEQFENNHLKVFGMASLRKNQKYATETSSKLSKCIVF